MDTSNQASVDPDRLRQLAMDLRSLAGRISELRQDLDTGLARLGETFRDEHYHEFRGLFMSSQRQLNEFVDEVRAYVPKLQHDADTISASQRIRPRV